MMKTHILTLLFLLAGLAGMAQTNQPLPPDAQPLTALTYLSPGDSTVWLYNERSSLAINVGVWADVVELFEAGWSNTQIDSAITANLAGYVPTSRQINGKALTSNITLNANDVGALQAGDDISDLVNDAGYITSGDIPAAPVTSVNSKTGDVVVEKADIGLGNVNNTSDANKPISTATQGALDGKENAFSKGSLVAGTGVTLSGTTANRLVGSGNVTINATPADLSDYVKKSGDTMTGALTVTGSTGSEVLRVERTGGSGGTITIGKGGSGTPLYMTVSSLGGGTQFNFSGASSWNFDTNISAPNLVTFNRTTNGLVPAPGGSGTTRFLAEDMTWRVPSGGGGGGTATDLSIQNRTASTLDIGSSTGTAATVPARTSTLAGLMLPGDLAAINASTQTLSLNGASTIEISGANAITLVSLSRAIIPDFDAYTPINGLNNFANTTGSSGFPSAVGSGVYFRRNTGNTTGSFAFYKSNDNSETIEINTGNGTSYNGWRTLWHSGNFSPSDYVSTANFTWGNLGGKPSTFAPSAHTHNASDIDAGTLAAARIGNATVSNAKLSNMSANTIKGRSGSTGAPQDLSASQVRSIINVANGATANSTDATLLNRANHTGTQAISTVSGLQSALDSRWVNAVSGGWNSGEIGGAFRTIASAADAPTATTYYGAFFPSTTSDYGIYFAGRGDRFFARSLENTSLLPWRELAQLGAGTSQVRNNSQLDARYLQSVSGGSGISVSGNTVSVDNTVIRTTGNQTVGGTKTFSSPVVVANATANNHAVNLGQLNSVVPEKPDWTQYGTEFVTQERPVIYPSGYFPIGSLSSLGVPYWANVLANSFVNVGDMVEVDGIVEITTNGSAGTNNAQIHLLGSTFTLRSGDPNIYDINIRFRYDGGTSVSYVIKVSSMLGANQAPYLDIFRGTASMSLSNNILVSVWVNTSTSGANRPVNVHEVRVTKYSAKFNN